MTPEIYAIPDIHGMYDRLIKLIDNLNPKENDTLIFLGDYIDRGLKTRDVIDYLLELKKRIKNCHFLMGNHEQLMLLALGKGDYGIFKTWIRNGGDSTLLSYGYEYHPTIKYKYLGKFEELLPKEHVDFFLDDLKPYFETEKYFFVHAGVNMEIPFEENNLDDFLWIRPPFFLDKTPKFPFNKHIIHGHTINNFVNYQAYHTGIDLGSYRYNGQIVAFSVLGNNVAASSM